ncbi:hypothetical protein XENTR_v10023972 [Xenopus tropicalis]|nr:hypothetical protein XENTR_v10023972 [Xenopus tropicalis]
MLPTSCSQRLLSLLNQALLSCKEEEKHLEQQLRECRVLLGPWKREKIESLKQNDKKDVLGDRVPSEKEMQEVELLNKALEKALRVRGTSNSETNAPKMPSSTQRMQSHPTVVEKPVKPTCKTADLRTKPVAYRLNPPYRTNPEMKRAGGSGRTTSNGKSMGLPCSVQPGKTKDNNSNLEQSEAKQESNMSKNNTIGSSTGDSSLPAPSENPEESKAIYVSLKHIGAFLKLPMEYRREYSRNNRLWDKFYEIQNIISSPQPSFMEMLQETFVPGSPRQSLAELEEETVRLKMAVASVQQRIDIIEKWPAAGKGKTQMLLSTQQQINVNLNY